jgi:multiple sugar transport system permease protein
VLSQAGMISPRPRLQRPRRRMLQLPLSLVLTIGALLMVFPFLWMVLGTFKSNAEILEIPPTFLPHQWTLENFQWIFDRLPIAYLFFNTVFVTATVTVVVLFTSALAGYVFAKFHYWGRDLLFLVVLSTMMIPVEVTLIPLYLEVQALKLLDSYGALIVPFVASPFGIFLMRQFMHSIPNDYLDAARIDGLSEFGIFLRIILPLTGPALSALAIMTIIGQWDSLLWPIIVINSTQYKTLAMGLSSVAAEYGRTLYGVTLAGASISVLPILTAFILLQRRFISGMVMSGIKA